MSKEKKINDRNKHANRYNNEYISDILPKNKHVDIIHNASTIYNRITTTINYSSENEEEK